MIDLFKQKILMCHPINYDVKYRINPWMFPDDPNKSVNNSLAIKQWINLHHVLIRLGSYIEYIESDESVPDMVFTANAGVLNKNTFIPSNFKHEERKKESAKFADFFSYKGFDVVFLDEEINFEGAGDALFNNDTLFCGYGFRTDFKAIDKIEKILNVNVVPCKLVDPYFYHLDTCFCPLKNNQAIVYTNAFDRDTIKLMEKHLELIDVPENEAKNFACNSVLIENKIVMPKDCPITVKKLKSFDVYPVDVTEFIKAGGAVKCLTLVLTSETSTPI
jgi:N-dimethylarginine dimethylaminohydrolase